MSTIQSTIKLNDQMSTKLAAINRNMEATVNVAAQVNTQINNTTNNATNNINNFNYSMSNAAKGGASSLTTALKRLVAAAAGIMSIKSTIGLSDELTSTSARLSMVGQAFNEAGFDVEEFNQKIYSAANASRGSYGAMADLVNRLGMNATDAFTGTDELLQFAEGVQKIMTISGASTTEAANAELQLSQALASGVLRGDELNSIFEQSPMLIQKIADYMGVPIGEIRSMASEGEITADIVKNAVLSATDDINDQFEQMPMTFGQAMTQLSNVAMQRFTPLLNRINQALNSELGQKTITTLINSIDVAAQAADQAMTALGDALEWCYENADLLGKAIAIAAGAVLAYNVVSGVAAGLTAAFGVAQGAAAAAHGIYTAAVGAATAGQSAFNAALYACPITWIVALIMLLIVALGALTLVLANQVAKAGGTASSAFAVLCGWFANGIAIAQDTAMVLGTVAQNIANFFTNCVLAIEWAFWGLLEVVTSVVASIVGLINKIPGVSIDMSGVEGAVAEYAANRAAAVANLKGVQGFGEFKTPGAYQRGATWGNDKWNKLTGLKDKIFGGSGSTGLGGLAAGTDSVVKDLDKTAANTGSTAGNTGAIKDKLDDTNEDLKYLCDIAERDAINRFTTASIAIDMVNNNSISSGLDLDNIVDGLTSRLQSSMAMVAEGA